jgi:predicted XRE-type DNA-binding protein
MIYYVRHLETGLIKIGYSAAVLIRLKQLEAYCGAVELLGAHEGNLAKEKAMHQQFAHARSRGVLGGKEWFNPTGDLTDYIKANTQLEMPDRDEKLLPIFYPAKSVPPNEEKFRFESAVPDLIKAYLNQTGMTCAEFAQACGLDASTVSRLMHSNPKRIDMKMAEKLRKVIGFEPLQLLKKVWDK